MFRLIFWDGCRVFPVQNFPRRKFPAQNPPPPLPCILRPSTEVLTSVPCEPCLFSAVAAADLRRFKSIRRGDRTLKKT